MDRDVYIIVDGIKLGLTVNKSPNIDRDYYQIVMYDYNNGKKTYKKVLPSLIGFKFGHKTFKGAVDRVHEIAKHFPTWKRESRRGKNKPKREKLLDNNVKYGIIKQQQRDKKIREFRGKKHPLTFAGEYYNSNDPGLVENAFDNVTSLECDTKIFKKIQDNNTDRRLTLYLGYDYDYFRTCKIIHDAVDLDYFGIFSTQKAGLISMLANKKLTKTGVVSLTFQATDRQGNITGPCKLEETRDEIKKIFTKFGYNTVCIYMDTYSNYDINKKATQMITYIFKCFK